MKKLLIKKYDEFAKLNPSNQNNIVEKIEKNIGMEDNFSDSYKLKIRKLDSLIKNGKLNYEEFKIQLVENY